MLKSVGQPIPAISHRLAQNEDAIDLFKMVLDGKSLLSYVQFGTTIKDSVLDSIEHRIPFDLFTQHPMRHVGHSRQRDGAMADHMKRRATVCR